MIPKTELRELFDKNEKFLEKIIPITITEKPMDNSLIG
jgi:hypothetical protein